MSYRANFGATMRKIFCISVRPPAVVLDVALKFISVKKSTVLLNITMKPFK